MNNLIFNLNFIVALCIATYYVVIHIIKLWSGCDASEAATKLHNAINGKINYTFSNDASFEQNVEETIKTVIGDARFSQLIKLSRTAIDTPLLSFGYNSGLPYIAISVYYQDDKEKLVLENLLTKLVCRYLQINGFSPQILVDWKNRSDLQMPVLMIRYAQNKEERRILDICLQNTRKDIITQNTDVIDDTDEENLNE